MQTIHLDEIAECPVFAEHRQRLGRALTSSKRIVAITGAGISVSAGIPVSLINTLIEPYNYLLTVFL